MAVIGLYASKEELISHVGKPLNYVAPSKGRTLFDCLHKTNFLCTRGEASYKDDGYVAVANLPKISGRGKVFVTIVFMKDGLIQRVC